MQWYAFASESVMNKLTTSLKTEKELDRLHQRTAYFKTIVAAIEQEDMCV